MTGTPNTWQACAFPALAYFARGFHEQTMTFAKHNDLCRDGQTLATPQQARIQTELLLLFPTELNHQEERLLKTVSEDFGQVLELLP